MNRFGMALATCLLLVDIVSACAAELKPELAGIGFLLGHWTSTGPGQVADTRGTSSGTVTFTREVDGAVILRKDHVSLKGRAGKPAGSFDILMMIYAEAGTLHADYADGDHVIHYTSAEVVPGHSVIFQTAPSAEAPGFKLAYTLVDPKSLAIAFSMAPPGSGGFYPIATGTAARDR